MASSLGVTQVMYFPEVRMPPANFSTYAASHLQTRTTARGTRGSPGLLLPEFQGSWHVSDGIRPPFLEACPTFKKTVTIWAAQRHWQVSILNDNLCLPDIKKRSKRTRPFSGYVPFRRCCRRINCQVSGYLHLAL